MRNKAGFTGIVADQCSDSTFNSSLSSNGSLEIWIWNGQMDWTGLEHAEKKQSIKCDVQPKDPMVWENIENS